MSFVVKKGINRDVRETWNSFRSVLERISTDPLFEIAIHEGILSFVTFLPNHILCVIHSVTRLSLPVCHSILIESSVSAWKCIFDKKNISTENTRITYSVIFVMPEEVGVVFPVTVIFPMHANNAGFF